MAEKVQQEIVEGAEEGPERAARRCAFDQARVAVTRCSCCCTSVAPPRGSQSRAALACLQMGGDRPERAGLSLFLDKHERLA